MVFNIFYFQIKTQLRCQFPVTHLVHAIVLTRNTSNHCTSPVFHSRNYKYVYVLHLTCFPFQELEIRVRTAPHMFSILELEIRVRTAPHMFSILELEIRVRTAPHLFSILGTRNTCTHCTSACFPFQELGIRVRTAPRLFSILGTRNTCKQQPLARSPFYISICISTLPTLHTTFTKISLD